MWGKEDGFYGIRQRCPKPHGEDHYPASSDLVHSGFRIWQPIRPPNGGLKASTNASLLELLIRYHNRLCSDSRDKSTLSQDSLGMEVLICGLTITRNWAESSRDAFQMIVKEMRELSAVRHFQRQSIAVRTSWTPDWSIPLEEQVFVPPRNVRSYSAAAGTPAAVASRQVLS